MLTHEHNGRLWIEIGRRPHVRKDGETVELICWSTRCAAEGCDGSVDIATRTAYEKAQDFSLVHCPEHKLTQAQAAERWQAALREGREKARTASRACTQNQPPSAQSEA